MKEATRVEWCKTYSCMNRWKEEVALLDEEMRRTLVSIEYDAVVWEKAAKTSDRGTAEGEGRIAYAQGKAFVLWEVSKKFMRKWKEVRRTEETMYSAGDDAQDNDNNMDNNGSEHGKDHRDIDGVD